MIKRERIVVDGLQRNVDVSGKLTSKPLIKVKKGARNPNHKKYAEIGSYVLFKTVGKGAFGRVMLGVDRDTGMQVVVKIFDEYGSKSSARTHKQEIEAMKRLHGEECDRVVKLLAYGR